MPTEGEKNVKILKRDVFPFPSNMLIHLGMIYSCEESFNSQGMKMLGYVRTHEVAKSVSLGMLLLLLELIISFE
jgi:hypothetical protein